MNPTRHAPALVLARRGLTVSALVALFILLRIDLLREPAIWLGWNSDSAIFGLMAKRMRDGAVLTADSLTRSPALLDRPAGRFVFGAVAGAGCWVNQTIALVLVPCSLIREEPGPHGLVLPDGTLRDWTAADEGGPARRRRAR